MYHCRITLMASLTLVLGLLVTNSYADRTGLKKPSEKQVRIYQARVMLVPKVTGGKVIGEASRRLGDRIQDKLVFGLAVSAEYYIDPGLAIGLNFDIIWKDLPFDDVKNIRTFSRSLSALYRPLPDSRRSIYFRPELGMISGTLPDYFGGSSGTGADLDLGTHTYIKLGVGLFAYGATRINTRFEFYYRRVFCEGYKLEQLYDALLYDDAEQIGIDIGVGIPLW
jgi:hypothetical protein